MPYLAAPTRRCICSLPGWNEKEDDTVLTIEQFANEPEKFTSLVTNDLNVAIRFAQLLPMMNPFQKNRVRDLVLVLPG